MEQNFGPHMEQKWAIFAPSAGKVYEWFGGHLDDGAWRSLIFTIAASAGLASALWLGILRWELLVFALVLGCASRSKIAPPAWLAERFFYALESVVVLGAY